MTTYDFVVPIHRAPGEGMGAGGAQPRAIDSIESALLTLLAVSYTHLTLPTILRV